MLEHQFYVAAVDDLIRKPQHAPTVGILLCTDKNKSVVRYSLGATASPVAVASYTYETLPPQEQAALPEVEQLQQVLRSQPRSAKSWPMAGSA